MNLALASSTNSCGCNVFLRGGTMVGPEAVVQQVWQQVVPTDWKIIRGKRRSAFAVGIRAAAWTCAALVLLALAALAQRASQAGRSSAGRADMTATFAGYPAL